MAPVTRVGVLGCGLMGAGIAEVSARAGLDVVVREVDAAACEAGDRRIRTSLARAVNSGKLDPADEEAALARLQFTTDFDDLADRQLVVEAVIEDEAEKTAAFAALDKAVKDDNAL